MTESIARWLDGLGLGQFVELFAEQQIDFEVLPELSEDDFEKLGIPLGPRKKLLKGAAALRHSETKSDSGKAPASDSVEGMATWERHPDERKPATVLFADVTGSTALTEQLDAEDTHELLDGARQRICAAIESNRGTICRVTGDGVMAVFGAPIASERHALDACVAAWDMQQAIGRYAAEVKARHGRDLKIRVGLHSGEIVVLSSGDGERAEYDADGPTVPVAARMEQSATPGETYLTAATYALVSSRIETDALGPISVKGISEPVRVFALRRVRPVEESVLGGGTAFVGRRAELRQLQGFLGTCLDDGQGQTIYIRGEPGIGKTRLVEEFAKLAVERGLSTHRGLVLQSGVGKGQDAIRSLVRSLLGIRPGAGKDERALAAQAALMDDRLAPDQAVFLNDLLDLTQSAKLRTLYDAMENTTRNEGKQAVVSTLVSAASNSPPILLIIEDVHWADPLTLGHVAELTKTVADCPALLVITSRIEGDQLDQSWRSTTDGSPFTSIDLGPLRKQDSISLIGEFVDSRGALAESCLEKAAGNPLFLEQLLRNAVEGTTESLPDSIQSLVLARLDRLEARDKRALQAASVIGQRFDAGVLRSLLDSDDYDCHELVAHNLVRPVPHGFLFTHALIQESVYGSLLKNQRRTLHLKAARWFTSSDLSLKAEHLGQAGDGDAPIAFLEAAQEQAGRYRLEKAIALVQRGLELSADDERFVLQCLQGELLLGLGLPRESVEAFGKAKESAFTDVDRCRAAVGAAEGLRVSEAHDELLRELSFAEAIAGDGGLSLELARIQRLRSGVHFLRGEVDACLKASQAALQYAEATESPETKAQSLSVIGDAEYLRGRLISAYNYFDQCISASREQGFGKTLAANLVMRGITFWYQCEPARCMQDHEEAVTLSQETGQSRTEMLARCNGIFWLDLGDLRKAERWLKRSIDLAQRLGSGFFLGESLTSVGQLEFLKGHHAEAETLVQRGLDVLRESGGMAYAGPQALGRLALVTVEPRRRRTALSEAEALLRGNSISHNYIAFYPMAMDACLEMGDWDEVDRHAQSLVDFTSAEPLPLSDLYIGRGRALASFGRGNPDDATKRELQRLRDEAERIGLETAIPALDDALSST